jgi:repressor LexA
MPVDRQGILRAFYSKQKRLPSVSEAMRLFKLRSRDGAYQALRRIAEAGFIEKDKSGKFIPGRLFHEIRKLGLVEAGWPSPAEEELTDTISLDEWLIQNKEATYILTIKGDSMIDAGIMPGDTVLVERGTTYRNGDIVIAEVDHEWTIKYFRKVGNQISLVPANKKYKPIIPEEELKIVAVVKAVIRKY